MRFLQTILCLLFASASLLGQPPKPRVRLMTSYGPILLELEPEAAPKTVENFLDYVKEGFYAGTIFHRVIPGFMIQGGGFTENLQEKPTHASVQNEADQAAKAGLLNTRGTLAMARTDDPHSATAQFFINTADNPRLDHRDLSREGYGYCVFGRVVEGMDVVAKIEKVITVTRKGMSNVPEYAVRIKSAELVPAP
jgi:cyclophilin family peptidyl-prolyl cis-trans isomerase